jgi:hypothetical protein
MFTSGPGLTPIGGPAKSKAAPLCAQGPEKSGTVALSPESLAAPVATTAQNMATPSLAAQRKAPLSLFAARKRTI